MGSCNRGSEDGKTRVGCSASIGQDDDDGIDDDDGDDDDDGNDDDDGIDDDDGNDDDISSRKPRSVRSWPQQRIPSKDQARDATGREVASSP